MSRRQGGRRKSPRNVPVKRSQRLIARADSDRDKSIDIEEIRLTRNASKKGDDSSIVSRLSQRKRKHRDDDSDFEISDEINDDHSQRSRKRTRLVAATRNRQDGASNSDKIIQNTEDSGQNNENGSWSSSICRLADDAGLGLFGGPGDSPDMLSDLDVGGSYSNIFNEDEDRCSMISNEDVINVENDNKCSNGKKILSSADVLTALGLEPKHMHNIPKASDRFNSGDVGSSLDTPHKKNCWRRLVNILANGFFHN